MRLRTELLPGRGLALWPVMWLATLLGPGAAGAERASAAGAGLVERLNATGRAEARIERRAPDPFGGVEQHAIGRLSLESPDRARLDFERTRESVTLRANGGEWLQPELRQMIRFGPVSARVGLRWWNVMLGRSGVSYEERALGGGRYLLLLSSVPGAAADSAWVTVGGDRLPQLLEVAEADGAHVSYRLDRWRFTAPRGAAAFVLRAPVGFETVDMR